MNNQESLSHRTQVAKNPKYKRLKDRLLLIGVIVVCLGIALSGLLPRHKLNHIIEEETKESTTQQLNDNLALIAAMREKEQNLQDTESKAPSSQNVSSNKVISKETLARMNAPSTFYSQGSNTFATIKNRETLQTKTLLGQKPNSQFLNQQNDITTVLAKKLPHPTMTVPAGEMIPATLENAINVELAGMARAITTRNIYALSGQRLLIPKGSTVLGQFNTAITQGQKRIFVVWNRLQMTNGIIVTLNSPSTDSIGRSGQAADYIDRHFFERFGSGALLSVLGAYTAISGVHGQDETNSLSQYRTNIAGSFQQATNQTLQQDMKNTTTLQGNQGSSINIFVAHDLDFYHVRERG